MKCIFAGIFLVLLSASAFAQNSSCDVSLNDGSSFLLEISESHSSIQMVAQTIGLFGHCERSVADFICTSSKGELVEFTLPNGQFRWETLSGDRLRGVIACE